MIYAACWHVDVSGAFNPDAWTQQTAHQSEWCRSLVENDSDTTICHRRRKYLNVQLNRHFKLHDKHILKTADSPQVPNITQALAHVWMMPWMCLNGKTASLYHADEAAMLRPRRLKRTKTRRHSVAVLCFLAFVLLICEAVSFRPFYLPDKIQTDFS